MTYSLPTLPANYPIPTLVPVLRIVDRAEDSDEILDYYHLCEVDQAEADAATVGGRVVRDMIEPEVVRVVEQNLIDVRTKTFTDVDEAIAYAKELVKSEPLYSRTVPQSDSVLASWTLGRFAIEVIA